MKVDATDLILVGFWLIFVGFMGFSLWMARISNARINKREDISAIGLKGWD